jgi:hypothetical protein
MLAVASNSDAQQNEVPLAENADVIERLLLILRDTKVSLKTDAEYTQLFEMVGKYDVLHVSNYLALAARRSLKKHELSPLAAFIIAANLDDQELAALSIARFTMKSGPAWWILEDVKRIPIPYFLRLTQACDGYPKGSWCPHSGGHYMVPKAVDWRRVAEHFELLVSS